MYPCRSRCVGKDKKVGPALQTTGPRESAGSGRPPIRRSHVLQTVVRLCQSVDRSIHRLRTEPVLPKDVSWSFILPTIHRFPIPKPWSCLDDRDRSIKHKHLLGWDRTRTYPLWPTSCAIDYSHDSDSDRTHHLDPLETITAFQTRLPFSPR